MNNVCLLYYHACIKYGIRPTLSPHIAGFTFRFGKRIFVFRGMYTPLNDSASASIGANKYCTNRLLAEAGIPVPNADCVSIHEPELSREALANLKFPLVVKPTYDTSCGTDVTCNIKDTKTLNTILEPLYEKYKCISVEEYQPGLRSYRLLVAYNKVVGVVERIPAHVIGDGEHTIEQLIELKNTQRDEMKAVLPLGKIRIMPETEIIFKELGITADYIPMLNEKVPIRYICNSTFGGSIIGINLKTIAKENADLICKAAKTLNLNIGGFDFICTDITIPYNKSKGFIIEVNTNPDISIHETVVTGVPTAVSEGVIRRFILTHFGGYLLHIMRRPIISLILRITLIFVLAFLGYQYYVLG